MGLSIATQSEAAWLRHRIVKHGIGDNTPDFLGPAEVFEARNTVYKHSECAHSCQPTHLTHPGASRRRRAAMPRSNAQQRRRFTRNPAQAA